MKKMIKRILALLFRKDNPLKIFSENNPFGVQIGMSSFFEIPMQINGGEYIKIGNRSSIGRNAWLGAFDSYLEQKFSPQIIIGDDVRIGNYVCITAIDKIEIAKGCLFSEYIYISDHGHGTDPSTNLSPKDQDLYSKGPVKIGENTFLGYRVCILPGVVLGKNCVVGANSVVTKSFPDYTMLAGSPARAIKRFSFEENKWINI